MAKEKPGVDTEARRLSQVDAMVRSRVAGIMAAGGVSHAQASQELLFLLPPEFVRGYEQLFDTALRLDNGSHTGQGERAGELGKAPADSPLPGTLKGLRIKSDVNAGAAPRVGGGGKRFKNIWTVRNDDALALKHRLDKRLRGMAREIAEFVAAGGRFAEDEGRDSGVAVNTRRCAGCGRAMAIEWQFCPNDGEQLGFEPGGQGNAGMGTGN